MDGARTALEKLSSQLPDLKARRQQALDELRRLTREQEDVARQAEKLTKQETETDESRKAWGKAAKKQAEVAEKLSKLDVPGQEQRKARAEQSQRQALADLMDCCQGKAAASQDAAISFAYGEGMPR